MSLQGLNALNDWRNPAYINRKKFSFFTGKSSYDILIKHCKVKTLKKKVCMDVFTVRSITRIYKIVRVNFHVMLTLNTEVPKLLQWLHDEGELKGKLLLTQTNNTQENTTTKQDLTKN